MTTKAKPVSEIWHFLTETRQWAKPPYTWFCTDVPYSQWSVHKGPNVTTKYKIRISFKKKYSLKNNKSNTNHDHRTGFLYIRNISGKINCFLQCINPIHTYQMLDTGLKLDCNFYTPACLHNNGKCNILIYFIHLHLGSWAYKARWCVSVSTQQHNEKQVLEKLHKSKLVLQ